MAGDELRCGTNGARRMTPDGYSSFPLIMIASIWGAGPYGKMLLRALRPSMAPGRRCHAGFAPPRQRGAIDANLVCAAGRAAGPIKNWPGLSWCTGGAQGKNQRWCAEERRRYPRARGNRWSPPAAERRHQFRPTRFRRVRHRLGKAPAKRSGPLEGHHASKKKLRAEKAKNAGN